MSKINIIDNLYTSYLKNLNVDFKKAFKKIGIDSDEFNEDAEIYLGLDQYIDFFNSVDEVIDEDLIIKNTNIGEMKMSVPLLFAAMCSKDGVNCFKRISRYKKILGPFVIDIKIIDGKFIMEFLFEYDEISLPRLIVLIGQVLAVSIIRNATGVKINPLRVLSKYEYGEGFREFFGIIPGKDLRNIIEFRLEDMEIEFNTSNNIMWEYLEPELKKRIEAIKSEETVTSKVREELFHIIPSGQGQIENVSRNLAMSVRTLQRRLSEEKTTFSKELRYTKEILARHYLMNSSVSNDEIGFLIGYSDGKSFSRAFKGWTRMTPKDFRLKYINDK